MEIRCVFQAKRKLHRNMILYDRRMGVAAPGAGQDSRLERDVKELDKTIQSQQHSQTFLGV